MAFSGHWQEFQSQMHDVTHVQSMYIYGYFRWNVMTWTWAMCFGFG